MAELTKRHKFWSQPYSYLIFFIFPALIVAIWFSPRWVVQTMMIAFMAWAAWEWAVLSGLKRILSRLLYAGGILVPLLWVAKHTNPPPHYPDPGTYPGLLDGSEFFIHVFKFMLPYFLIIAVLWGWAITGFNYYKKGRPFAGFQHAWVRACFGFFAVSVAGFSVIVVINKIEPSALVAGLIVIWSSDIGFYLGRRWNKSHLMSNLLCFVAAILIMIGMIIVSTDPLTIVATPLVISALLFLGWLTTMGGLFGRSVRRLSRQEGTKAVFQAYISAFVNSLLVGLSLFSAYMIFSYSASETAYKSVLTDTATLKGLHEGHNA